MMQRLQVVNPNKRKRSDELDNQNISGSVELDFLNKRNRVSNELDDPNKGNPDSNALDDPNKGNPGLDELDDPNKGNPGSNVLNDEDDTITDSNELNDDEDDIPIVSTAITNMNSRKKKDIPYQDFKTCMNHVLSSTSRKKRGDVHEGPYYVTPYARKDIERGDYTDQSNYSEMEYLFGEYSEARSHIGNIAQILNQDRIKLLCESYKFFCNHYLGAYGVKLLELMGLSQNELFRVYIATFDPA
jgi:hypothetical protein